MNARYPLLVAFFGIAVILPSAPGRAQSLTPEQTQFFESKVRPILVSSCYKCHSTEEKKAKGGLVLDSREGWQKGGKHGPALVPGDLDQSRLITAVRYNDPDLQMPPDGAKLSDQQIAVLEQWVKMGAPDPRTAPASGASKLTGLNDKARAHWAYQPVKKPEVPSVKDPSWVKTPVDAFVLAKLEANGMKPSHPAPREALIRRATYDLIGLPPTPEEVRAFVNDRSANAFEKVVDRLLNSPQYGERWGRFWLDSARYSDTTGSENRREEYRYPYAWTYRDYVIKSFNEDKPYDQFLKEQLAADLLPESKKDPSRLAALGFITVGKRFQNPNDTIDERIDATSKAMLGLTVACARCHDHKFDPIPTADYYSLHGVFASVTEPAEKPVIGPAPDGPEYRDFKEKLAQLEEKNREIYYDLIDQKSAEFRRNASGYLQVMLLARRGGGPRGQADAAMQKERLNLIRDLKLDRDLYQGGLRGLRPAQNPALVPLFRFATIPDDQFADRAKQVLAEITRGGGVGVGPRRMRINPLVVKAFAEAGPASIKSFKDVCDVYGRLFASIDDKARDYLKACRTARSGNIPGFEPALVQLIEMPTPVVPAFELTADKLREIAPTLPLANAGAMRVLRLNDVNELLLTHPGAPPRAMVVEDSPNPRNSPIFIRGEAQNRGPVVPRQFLEILAGPNRKPFKEGSGRLELAEAIASKDNPLTARVMVNRIWMHHFGEGFVRTPDDLGVMSEPPSNPELLDYLASRFMEERPSTSSGQGWSVKNLHRLIMLSSAYQQSSDTNVAYAQKDPGNRLLWRANLRRLDFEAVRDSMLMYTGKLDTTLGGKPVNLTDEPYSNRRSVYGYIDRGDVPELMAQFDFADPDMANSHRTSTIVPQQALFFMNSPMAVDVARKVTTRPEFVNAKDDPARVKALYEVLFQRAPKAEEVRLAAMFINAANGALASADKDDDGGPRRPAARRRQERQKEMAEARQARQVAAAKRQGPGRRAIRNEGERVERKPLTPWEEYAQALLFTNEIVYVN